MGICCIGLEATPTEGYNFIGKGTKKGYKATLFIDK
jgi:hypothetical protein